MPYVLLQDSAITIMRGLMSPHASCAKKVSSVPAKSVVPAAATAYELDQYVAVKPLHTSAAHDVYAPLRSVASGLYVPSTATLLASPRSAVGMAISLPATFAWKLHVPASAGQPADVHAGYAAVCPQWFAGSIPASSTGPPLLASMAREKRGVVAAQDHTVPPLRPAGSAAKVRHVAPLSAE